MDLTRRGLLPVLLVTLSLVTARAFAEDDAATAPELSATMSWDQIGRALTAYPPSFDHGDQRLEIYLTPKQRNRLAQQVDVALITHRL